MPTLLFGLALKQTHKGVLQQKPLINKIAFCQFQILQNFDEGNQQ